MKTRSFSSSRCLCVYLALLCSVTLIAGNETVPPFRKPNLFHFYYVRCRQCINRVALAVLTGGHDLTDVIHTLQNQDESV